MAIWRGSIMLADMLDQPMRVEGLMQVREDTADEGVTRVSAEPQRRLKKYVSPSVMSRFTAAAVVWN